MSTTVSRIRAHIVSRIAASLLGVFCWSFAAASLVRLWGVLAGGGALMTTVAWLLSRSLN